VKRSRGGLVFKAHRLCVSRSSRLESGNGRYRGGRGQVVVGGEAHYRLCGVLEPFLKKEFQFIFPKVVLATFES